MIGIKLVTLEKIWPRCMETDQSLLLAEIAICATRMKKAGNLACTFPNVYVCRL